MQMHAGKRPLYNPYLEFDTIAAAALTLAAAALALASAALAIATAAPGLAPTPCINVDCKYRWRLVGGLFHFWDLILIANACKHL